MSFPGFEYLSHIIDEAKYLISQTEDLKQSDFAENETLQRAFTRSIEIIGEATKKIPYELKQRYPRL